MNLDEVTTAAIDRYVRAYVNNGREQFASRETPAPVETVELEIGAPLPSVNLTGIDGPPVSIETLSGRPAINWFTTAPVCLAGSARSKSRDATMSWVAGRVRSTGLASMPVPMEGRGTLLYESLRALLPVVLSVGLAAMAWLMKWRYGSLIFAIGNNDLGNPVSAPGQEQKAGKLSTRSEWTRQ